MALAQIYQVPRSVLLGRELRSVTTYEYDETGRLARSVTVHESAWTDEDIDWALAKKAEDDNQCPGCRLPLAETTAMHEGRPVNRYKVDDPYRCYACDAKIKKQEGYAELSVVRPEAQIWMIERET